MPTSSETAEELIAAYRNIQDPLNNSSNLELLSKYSNDIPASWFDSSFISILYQNSSLKSSWLLTSRYIECNGLNNSLFKSVLNNCILKNTDDPETIFAGLKLVISLVKINFDFAAFTLSEMIVFVRRLNIDLLGSLYLQIDSSCMFIVDYFLESSSKLIASDSDKSQFTHCVAIILALEKCTLQPNSYYIFATSPNLEYLTRPSIANLFAIIGIQY